MPIHVMTVRRVDPCMTANPNVTSFQVWGIDVETERAVSYQTINQLRATLCQRAMETQRAIRVTWADSRYGKKIVEVELA